MTRVHALGVVIPSIRVPQVSVCAPKGMLTNRQAPPRPMS